MSDKLMLEQVLIESTHNKKEIREIVRREVIAAYNSGDLTPFDTAVDLLEEWLWLDDHGYESKNIRVRTIRNDPDFVPEEVVLDILSTLLTAPVMTIQNVAAYIAGSVDTGDLLDNIKTASEIIAVVQAADLYEIILPANSETGSLLVRSLFELSQDVVSDVLMRHYLPPMLVKPNKVTNNFDCGYMTVREHVVLKPHNSDNTEKLAYDALNITNAIAMSIDTHMLQWDEELTEKHDTALKQLNFQSMAKASRRVYDLMLRNGNKFYMPNRYCARGRMHMQGYHINLQSGKYKRALVNLEKKELIGGI
jgi:hypothetical protein